MPSRGAIVRTLSTIWLSLLLSTTPAPAQRPGSFTVLGPGGGGAMYHPAISPHDTNTVLVACDMTGSYITHDGGQSWRMFNLRGVSKQFLFDPVKPNVIYDVGIGLWKSTDSGETWNMLWPAPAEIHGVRSYEDHADVSLIQDGESDAKNDASPITSAAVDARNGQHLVAARGGKRLGLWSTNDGGVHWTQLAPLTSPAEQVYVQGKDIWIAGADGFAHWNGKALHTINGPVLDKKMADVAVDYDHDKTRAMLLLGVIDGQLYIAVLQGTEQPKWRAAVLPGTEGQVTTAAGAHDGRTIYASFHDLKMDGKSWQGIAKSADAGEHWSLIWKDAGQGAPNFQDGWISASHGSDWGGGPLTISVSSKDPALVYATDLGRTMKSTDAGAHWQALYSHPGKDGSAVSSGLDVLTSYGTFFDPFDARYMYIAYTDVGLFRSEDGGASWTSSTAGVPPRWRNTTYWIAFDPKVRGRLWAAMSGTHDLPRPRMWRHTPTSKYHGGVCISDDGGKHWTASNAGLPDGAVTHIVIDPDSPVDHRVLYATVMGHGIFKSSDGGKTWQRKGEGITQEDPLTFRLVQAADKSLYAIVVRRSEDGSIGNAGDGALYRSHDGAETWRPVALPAGVNAPNGLLVDPRDPSRMYLAAWARAVGQHGEGGGIYLSTDRGEHWQPLFTGDQHIYDVTFDPASPGHLYATGFESSAWKSLDRGAHWQRIAGFNFHWAHRVIPDQRRPGWVYINTFGGGVWHGQVNGASGVEDIATEKLIPGRTDQ